MTKEDILRLRDTAEQTRVQFKERMTRDNKYDVSCEMVVQSSVIRVGMMQMAMPYTCTTISIDIVTEETEIKETKKAETTHCLRSV